jgi:hypothetical protein
MKILMWWFYHALSFVAHDVVVVVVVVVVGGDGIVVVSICVVVCVVVVVAVVVVSGGGSVLVDYNVDDDVTCIHICIQNCLYCLHNHCHIYKICLNSYLQTSLTICHLSKHIDILLCTYAL